MSTAHKGGEEDGKKQRKKRQHRTKKTQIIVTALFLITLIAVAVTIWALFFRKTTPVLTPDYAPQETETHAEPIPGDSDNRKNGDNERRRRGQHGLSEGGTDLPRQPRRHR